MLRTALKFMLYEKSKSVGIIIGIIIAVFLIGQQLSTLGFLMNLMKALIENSDPQAGQIWVITDQSSNVNDLKLIDANFINKLKSIKGVRQTQGMIISPAVLKFSNGQYSNVILVGSQAPTLAMGPRATNIIQGNRNDLLNPQSFSVDVNDVKNFRHSIGLNTPIEINGKRAKFACLSKNLAAYGTSYLYSSLSNVRYYTSIPPEFVNAILVKVQDKKDIPYVVEMINKSFPGLRAWSRENLAKSTVSRIIKQTNMGISFGSLVLFAVISGFFIIGLTLYTATFDRVKDYGTLKAIGAKNSYISKIVLLQAFIYGVIAYFIAIFLLFGMKMGLSSSGLNLELSPGLLFLLLFFTLLISMGGSFFAINKLKSIEPASVFK